MYARILVATDGSACSEAAVAQGAELANALGSAVTFLHALDAFSLARDGLVDFAALHAELRAAGNRIIERAKDAARRAGIEAVGLVCEASPLEEIQRASNEHDLVVMGSHGWGFARRLLVGSVTAAVLHHVSKPVLVVRGRDAQGR